MNTNAFPSVITSCTTRRCLGKTGHHAKGIFGPSKRPVIDDRSKDIFLPQMASSFLCPKPASSCYMFHRGLLQHGRTQMRLILKYKFLILKYNYIFVNFFFSHHLWFKRRVVKIEMRNQLVLFLWETTTYARANSYKLHQCKLSIFKFIMQRLEFR